jgi:hypothetical protein
MREVIDMEKQMILTDVPTDQVDKIVMDFTSDGATKVAKEVQPNGNWTVRASFEVPDSKLYK